MGQFSPPLHYFLTFQITSRSFGWNYMYSFTASEHSWLTYPKEKFKLSNIKLNDSSKLRGGERLGRPILCPILSPHPSENLLPFYISLRLHNPFTVSELSWLKCVKEKFKFTKCLFY